MNTLHSQSPGTWSSAATLVANRAPAVDDASSRAAADERAPERELLGGILVCGGRSHRMGQDKARLVVHGTPMIARAADVLAQLCAKVVLACGPERRYADLGLELALDGVPDGGPLAGVIAGLEMLDKPHALVLACDMPRVSAPLFERLLQHTHAGRLDACYLATEGGLEPLCAIYSRSVLPAMREALRQGRRRMTAFLELEGLGNPLRVGQLQLTDLILDPLSASNLNTPEDLEREQREQAP